MPFNHFSALLLCAALIAIAFGWLTKPTIKERALSSLRYFLIFVLVSLALAWLMYPFSH